MDLDSRSNILQLDCVGLRKGKMVFRPLIGASRQMSDGNSEVGNNREAKNRLMRNRPRGTKLIRCKDKAGF